MAMYPLSADALREMCPVLGLSTTARYTGISDLSHRTYEAIRPTQMVTWVRRGFREKAAKRAPELLKLVGSAKYRQNPH